MMLYLVDRLVIELSKHSIGLGHLQQLSVTSCNATILTYLSSSRALSSANSSGI